MGNQTALKGDDGQSGEPAFVARLKSAMGDRSPAWLAKQTGIGDTTIRKYLSGSQPTIGPMAKIAEALEADLNWLITGKHSSPIRGDLPTTPGSRLLEVAEADWLFIPRYNALGMILLGDRPHPIEVVPVRRDMLARHISNFKNLWLTHMPSNALPSVAAEDELILCQDVVDQLEDGRPYILALGDGLVARRVFRTPECLVLRAEDELYAEEKITPDRMESVRPVGRILGSLALRPAR